MQKRSQVGADLPPIPLGMTDPASIAADAALIGSAAWPTSFLHVETRWALRDRPGFPRKGTIYVLDAFFRTWEVDSGAGTEKFPSLEALVEVWGVCPIQPAPATESMQ